MVAAKPRIEGSLSPAARARLAIRRRIAAITSPVRVAAAVGHRSLAKLYGSCEPYSLADIVWDLSLSRASP